MKASDMYRGLVVGLVRSGRDRTLLHKGKITEVGVRPGFTGRPDHSMIQAMDNEGNLLTVKTPARNEDGTYKYDEDHILVYEDTGEPKIAAYRNSQIISEQEYDQRVEEIKRIEEERERIRNMMAEAKENLTNLLVEAGLPASDVNVITNFDSDADVALVTRLAFTGDAVQILVNHFAYCGEHKSAGRASASAGAKAKAKAKARKAT
jgi:hypothetical protein